MKANDRDIGENSKSTYSIMEGNDQGVFEIVTDSQTQEGILRLRKVSWGAGQVFLNHLTSWSCKVRLRSSKVLQLVLVKLSNFILP